jgi:hypothetical protein
MRAHAKAVVLAVVLSFPGAAHAVSVGIDVGGGWWSPATGQLDFHVRVDQRLGRYVSIGIRPGALMNLGGPVQFGVPVDALVRFYIPYVYFDLIGGLAILFGDAYPLRGHAAVGFGVPFARRWSVGFEAGWLQHGAQLLARFAFTF